MYKIFIILFSLILLSQINNCSTFNNNVDSSSEWMSKIAKILNHPDNITNWGKYPSNEDIKLLEKFKPVISIAPNSYEPIDFYKNYLPFTSLRNIKNKKKIIKNNLTKNDLKNISLSHDYYLDYNNNSNINNKEYNNVCYARIYRLNTNSYLNKQHKHLNKLIVLKYNFVFLYSGLPAKLSMYKKLFLKLIGNAKKWHQLDIHGAIHIILNIKLKPIAVILAQHNHHRTYLLNKDILLPENNHINIAFASQSNEPYPQPPGNTIAYYRTISFPSSDSIDYLITGKNAPYTSGFDVVYPKKLGAKIINYKLKYLSEFDPLYTAQINLGRIEDSFSFYRSGPPGIDFATFPELTDFTNLMLFWYYKDNDKKVANLMKKYFKNFDKNLLKEIIIYNRNNFLNDLSNLSR